MPSVTPVHRLTALALLLIALSGVYGLIARPLLNKYHFYQNNIENLQERLQRLRGMLATRRELEAQIQRVQQDSSVDVYYLKQQSPMLGATDLQQQVKSIVEANGGRLISTQILPVTQEKGFSRVGINVQMTGDTKVLQRIIYALESNRPLLFINNLQVIARTIRYSGRDNQLGTNLQLTIQFDLAGYLRARES
jgi:general secretion pathway protein M